MRFVIVAGLMLFAVSAAGAQTRPSGDQFPPAYVPSGAALYKQFCSACHDADAKGKGPAAANLKTPPADLTTLAKRNGGKFPNDYVADVLQFGKGPSAHGSYDMPLWGPLFQLIDKSNEQAVKQRIKNLSDYLASVQAK